MPRYEINTVICIDARDGDDLKQAMDQILDEDDGITLPHFSGPERHARCYPKRSHGGGLGDLVYKLVDASFNPEFDMEDAR